MTDNIEAAVKTVVAKIRVVSVAAPELSFAFITDGPKIINVLTFNSKSFVLYLWFGLKKGPVMKVIHVKSQASVALPIYTCNMSHLDMLEKAEKQTETPKKVVRTDSSCVCTRFFLTVSKDGWHESPLNRK